MRSSQLVGITVAFLMNSACGTSPEFQVGTEDLENAAPLEELEAFSSSDDVETRVRLAFNKLRAAGRLNGPGIWRVKSQPAGPLSRVDLANDADQHISDGYQYVGLVPVEQTVTKFYIERTGGIAGWKSLAGPFALSQTVKIGELMAGKHVNVRRGEVILADLPYDLNGRHVWEASSLPSLGKPHQLILENEDPQGNAIMRFVWTTDNAHIQSGDDYALRFSLRDPVSAGAVKAFVVAVTIR